MKKSDFLILGVNILATILWIKFVPIKADNWFQSIFILLGVPIVIIYWELFKKTRNR